MAQSKPPLSNYTKLVRRQFIRDFIISAVNGKGALPWKAACDLHIDAMTLAERIYPDE